MFSKIGKEVVAFVKTDQVPNYAVFNSSGKYLYVSNAGSGNVSVIDTAKWVVARNIKIGMGPKHMYLDSHDEVLYVVNVIEGSVSVGNLADTKNVRKKKWANHHMEFH